MGYLENWLATFSSSNTVSQYRSGVGRFLRNVYGSGEASRLADKYIRERSSDLLQVELDVDSYYVSLRERPPKTQVAYLSAVKSFLADHRIELNASFWRKFSRRRKGKIRALTHDYIPNGEDLRRLTSHMPLRGKALFLLMSAAGTRIHESLLLRLEDIDIQRTPGRIQLRPETTKTGEGRISFLTDEAAENVDEWLKVRTKWMRSNAERLRGRFDTDPNDDRVFPFSVENAYAIWDLALKKSGLDTRDEVTKRRTLHPHCLRKRFRTLLGVHSVDLTEVLMGHESYLSDAYRRPTEEMLEEFYREVQHVLTLSVDRASVLELKKDAEYKTREVDDLKREMAELKSQLAIHMLRENERDARV